MSTGNSRSELLRIRSLTVAYPLRDRFVPVVRDFQLSLFDGEVLGLAGPSGSGKTTVALAILRLLPAGAIRAGEIQFQGANLLDLDEKDIRAYRGKRIGMVFQEPESVFNPLIPIGRQLAEVLRFHFGMTRQAALEESMAALAELGVLQPRRILDAYSRHVSVGELQRAQLAGALACRPNLLICDEPTAAVDARNRLRLLERLAEVRRQRHVSLLVISHDRGVLEYLADRVEFMPEETASGEET